MKDRVQSFFRPKFSSRVEVWSRLDCPGERAISSVLAKVLTVRFETLQGNNLIQVCLYLEHDSFEPFNSASYQVQKLLQKIWKIIGSFHSLYVCVTFAFSGCTLVQFWQPPLNGFRFAPTIVSEGYSFYPRVPIRFWKVFQNCTNARTVGAFKIK